MYLLDAKIISEIRLFKHGLCDENVANWVRSVSSDLMYTNVIVMMEIERGVRNAEKTDSVQGKILRNWFEHFVKPAFDGRIFPITEKTAKICSGLDVDGNNAWIASSAIEHNLILVTPNVVDLGSVDVRMFNPFVEGDHYA